MSLSIFSKLNSNVLSNLLRFFINSIKLALKFAGFNSTEGSPLLIPNIPLDILEKSLDLLNDKEKTIITCCASGMRSEKAKKILKKLEYSQVYNGGGWSSLNKKINK